MQNISNLNRLNLVKGNQPFSPKALYRQGEQGVWYDPSDLDNYLRKTVWTNNPAPEGFRVPTQAELAALFTAEEITNSAAAFNSRLKLTVAGYRNTAGALIYQGSLGLYWSSTSYSTGAYEPRFDSNSVTPASSNSRAYGFSVRPIWTGVGTPPAMVAGRGSDTNTYGVVLAKDGKYWLDRNLGASQIATSSTDTSAYGWIYQWGRGNDGHQITTSSTTATLSTTDNPGHGFFITTSVAPYDWRSGQNNALWQPVYSDVTMYQDSAGTIPVTAVEQPVGKIIDKSGRGNHASQSTSTKRPVLSARVNMLVNTATLATQSITTTATTHTLSFTGTGSVTLSGTSTGTYSSGSHSITCTAGTLTITVSGSVLTADLRPTNQGVNLPPYQRVGSDAGDYDTIGFPKYLKFDGTDDALQTNSIDFTSTDKMTVWVGMSSLVNNISYPVLLESANWDNNGSFSFIGAPTNILAFLSKGTVRSDVSSGNTIVMPYSRCVTTAISDISGDIARLRVNGVQASETLTDQGTGNYGNYPLYIGARAGTSVWFKGHLYQLLVRGASTLPVALKDTEKFVNGKTKSY